MTSVSGNAGYSGTPLAKKLGFKPGVVMATLDAPADYRTWVGDLPAGARVVAGVGRGRSLTAVHIFATTRTALPRHLQLLREGLEPDGFVWVSWPKRASKVPTDVTEGLIRELALPLGFVDVKVCAVTDVWSGLKLVIRKRLR
jgi:hypothetical protein